MAATKSQVAPDAFPEVVQYNNMALPSDPGASTLPPVAARRYRVDDLFGVFPENYFNK